MSSEIQKLFIGSHRMGLLWLVVVGVVNSQWCQWRCRTDTSWFCSATRQSPGGVCWPVLDAKGNNFCLELLEQIVYCLDALVHAIFLPPFPQIDIVGDWSNDDCLVLVGKRANCQVCSVQYCVQQLCIVQCTRIWTDVTVVCWLALAFLWLYCVLQFVLVRFSFWEFC